MSQRKNSAAQELARKRWKGITAAERSEFASRIAAQGAGRKPIPTPCARCGVVQPSARAAWAHCRTPR